MTCKLRNLLIPIFLVCKFSIIDFNAVSHQGCDLFYRLLYRSTRHIEKVEGGERDTQLVHVNEATAV
jgi:hypothetical protein